MKKILFWAYHLYKIIKEWTDPSLTGNPYLIEETTKRRTDFSRPFLFRKRLSWK